MKKAIHINFVGGACAGKSTMAALIYAELKMRHLSAEYVGEYAKGLIWAGKLDQLNNQYRVSEKQYNMIKVLDNVVDYIVCDSPLLVGLHYNRYSKTNVSNVEKTEFKIREWMLEFNNIYIYLERNEDYLYEQEGRVQDLEEAKIIDKLFIDLLKELNLPFLSIKSDRHNVEKIINYIIQK